MTVLLNLSITIIPLFWGSNEQALWTCCELEKCNFPNISTENKRHYQSAVQHPIMSIFRNKWKHHGCLLRRKSTINDISTIIGINAYTDTYTFFLAILNNGFNFSASEKE